MSNYTKTTNFKQKDTLATGNAQKIVKGGEVDTEFNNISTAVATKVDQVSISSANLVSGNGSGGIADSGLLIADIVTYSGGGGLIPSGGIVPYGGSSAPTGWLICNGAAVSRSVYADLFTAIGETYGVGNETTTFNIPDLVGRVPIGAGTGDATDATAHALGDEGGTETHTLTVDELAAHTHGYTAMEYIQPLDGVDSTVTNSNEHGLRAQTTDSTGGDAAHNNMQPYTTINYIIKT